LSGATLTIRAATRDDAVAIAEVYNEGIDDRLATFETRPREPAEAAAWLGDGLPFLVALDGDEVIGFARVSPYSDRCVYSGVGEHGVYVARRPAGAAPAVRCSRRCARRRSAPASTSSRAACSPTTPPAAPPTSPPGSTRWASSAATAGSTAAGRTACWSSGCSATRPSPDPG
jgi:hypothetical protein